MPGTFFKHVVEVLDAAGVFDLQDAEDLALRVERPHVGLLVILLLADAPVARGRGRAVAADAGRLIERGILHARIAAGADRVGGFRHGRDVREHDAVAAHVERLLGLPLRHLDAVDRDAHHRRHRRHQARLGDLRAVEHVLQAIPQAAAVPRIVLHLEHAAVELGRAHGDRRVDLGRREAGERMLARFEGADDVVQTRQIGHFLKSPLVRAAS